jgi:hypothetical protein
MGAGASPGDSEKRHGGEGDDPDSGGDGPPTPTTDQVVEHGIPPGWFGRVEAAVSAGTARPL